jgi:hypothetical protein
MTFLYGKIKNVPNHQPVIVCGKRIGHLILWCVWAISHRENDEEDESDGMGHPICQTNPYIWVNYNISLT